MTNDQRSSLLQMAKGAIQERVDYEVSRVVDNILDMNTEAKVKRKVVLTIVMVPDEDRQVVKIEASAKSALAPVTPVGTSLVITADGNGEMMLAEIVPQVPGQISMFPADGGVWKLEATRNVAAYFEDKLKDLIETGAVVVIR